MLVIVKTQQLTLRPLPILPSYLRVFGFYISLCIEFPGTSINELGNDPNNYPEGSVQVIRCHIHNLLLTLMDCVSRDIRTAFRFRARQKSKLTACPGTVNSKCRYELHLWRNDLLGLFHPAA